jgi:hypothetical protein
MRFLWLFLLLPLVAASPHKYYVSTTDIFYKADEQQLQLVVRVFTDDLQQALRNFVDQEISLDPNNKSAAEVETILGAYFQENFVLHNASEKVVFSFVGWEYKQDKTFLYASFENIGAPDQLAWSNSFLMEAFPDQKNIVTFHKASVKKSFLHTQGQILAQYVF